MNLSYVCLLFLFLLFLCELKKSHHLVGGARGFFFSLGLFAIFVVFNAHHDRSTDEIEQATAAVASVLLFENLTCFVCGARVASFSFISRQR